jgi:8-oxo-dGTP diphosphatase
LVTAVAGKRDFVLALLFTPDGQQVALMRRTRPAWQAGRINALGGKLLESESALDAARREVREEAGVDVAEWVEMLRWEDAEYRMHVVRAMSVRAHDVRTMEDQEVFLADVARLPAEVIGNLRWLVPLALDSDVEFPIVVRSANPDGSGLTERPVPGE